MGNLIAALVFRDFYVFLDYGYLEQTALPRLPAIADILIICSYYAIAISLVYLVYAKADLAFKKVLIVSSLTILCCGTTHLLKLLTLGFSLDGLLKVMTLLNTIATIYTAKEVIVFVCQVLKLPSSNDFQVLNTNLESNLKELQEKYKQINNIAKIVYFLQTCNSEQEALSSLGELLSSLFPQTNGTICISRLPQGLLESVSHWGNLPIQNPIILSDQCWAWRDGKTRQETANYLSACCKTIHFDSQSRNILCTPLIAQGQVLGILHLNFTHPEEVAASKLDLLETVSREIAVGLANLRNREYLEYISCHDSLTGLFNRLYLEASLERELYRAVRKEQFLGVIMLDIDHFKQFNDTYGHLAGDLVLKIVGTFIKENIRRSDIACRYGGEELTIIMPEASLKDVQERAEELRQGIKSLMIEWENKTLDSITVSIGIACCPDHGMTKKQLLDAADGALYEAKQQGRDLVVSPKLPNIF